MRIRVAIPDLISPSYFPVIAAVELGLMREEGIEAELALVYPVTKAASELRDGTTDLLAGAAHAPLYAFDCWRGVNLVAALAQNTYWFLVVRSENSARGIVDLEDVRIGAAPGPDLALREAFRLAGVDVAERKISLTQVPASSETGNSFGVAAARALGVGSIDGFWANGMGAAVAVREGTGRIILDARRAKGRVSALTFPALAATTRLIDKEPSLIEAAIRALVRAQAQLVACPEKATEIGSRLFPPTEASLIVGLIRNDSRFYKAHLPPEVIGELNTFASQVGLLTRHVAASAVVADQFSNLWGTSDNGPTR